jgi:hypothetical protein
VTRKNKTDTGGASQAAVNSPQALAPGSGSGTTASQDMGAVAPGTPAPVNKGERPFVYVDVLFDDGFLYVEVKNYSNSRPAFNVQTTFSPGLRGVEGTKVVSNQNLFKNIAFLAPRRSIRTFLDRSNSFFLRQDPMRYNVTVSYRDRFNAAYVSVIPLDLSIYFDIGFLGSSWQITDEQNDGLDIVHY